MVEMNENDPEQGLAQRGLAKRWIIAAIPLAIFLALAAIFMKQLAEGGGSHDVPSVFIGRPAPQFELPPLEGLKQRDAAVPGISRQTLEGKVTIINVWASWCVPCRTEQPVLMQLAENSNVQVLGLNYKDETANALRFLSQLGNPFAAVGVDKRGYAAIDWGVYGVPETFIVDANGIVRYKHIGPLTAQSYQEKFLPELEKVISGGES
jgi:cytochrome c biogenesis protein CcmG/thiol:disulfide interchange protein DsbE